MGAPRRRRRRCLFVCSSQKRLRKRLILAHRRRRRQQVASQSAFAAPIASSQALKTNTQRAARAILSVCPSRRRSAASAGRSARAGLPVRLGRNVPAPNARRPPETGRLAGWAGQPGVRLTCAPLLPAGRTLFIAHLGRSSGGGGGGGLQTTTITSQRWQKWAASSSVAVRLGCVRLHLSHR